MEEAIGEHYSVDPALCCYPELKRADSQLLIDEKAVLMVDEPEAWAPEVAGTQFLKRIKELS